MASAPFYLLRYRRQRSMGERFGRLPFPALKGSIWVHGVSVGEIRAVGALLERLRRAYPGRPLVLSTVTAAGRQLAEERRDVVDHCFFFPLDLPWTVRRTLEHVDPEMVVIAETEIWPNFVRACSNRGVRLVLVNGRIADRSFPRYRLVRRWLKEVLNGYALLGMQTEVDRERVETLGADQTRVVVCGNLKYDALDTVRAPSPELASALAARKPLWIAASTTPGEEELVLDAFAELRKHRPDLNLLIAPRRPERFDEVAAMVSRRGYACARRTRPGEAGDVLLLDTIGELASAFEFADVVFMGGTLVPRGGHNILEPARFSKPIVFGPHMENFREISSLFLDAGAAVQIPSAAELPRAIERLLSDGRLAAEVGGKARRVVEQNTGATDRVMALLVPAEVQQ